MQVSELRKPSAASPKGEALPFYQTTYGHEGRLNPLAKNWCFFLLEDDYQNIIGIYFAAGMTASARKRHLRKDINDLPVDDLPWSELYVLNPAQPDWNRCCYVILLTDWSQPHFVEPLMDASFRSGDLIDYHTLFTQYILGAEEDDSWFERDLGFRKIRVCSAKTPERAKVSVWVWQRDASLPLLRRQYRWELEATPEQVAHLTRFYQCLGKKQREELIYLVHNFSIQARVDGFGLKRRTINARREKIRLALEEELERWGVEKGLFSLGIDLQRGALNDLATLFCQPTVAQALKRIAWFYSELPVDLF
jgi:hypothetical protein